MKYHGRIGFYIEDVETSPDVYENVLEEHEYTGEIQSYRQSWNSQGSQNDELICNNRISIIANQFLLKNWASIRYVYLYGAPVKVKSVTIENYPRVTLEIGGAYNGKTA